MTLPPHLKNRVEEAVEQTVMDYAIEFQAHGKYQASNQLRKRAVFVSGSGVRSIWLQRAGIFCKGHASERS